MATDASAPAAATASAGPGEFRKRIPLELSPDDLARLRALQPEYGSMRATLLAGLEALARAGEADARLGELAQARDAAQARAATVEADLAAARAATAKEDARAKRAMRAVKDGSQRTAEQIDVLEAHVDSLTRDLADTHETLDATYQTLVELDETRVDTLRCPRCETYPPSEEWGYRQATDGSAFIFHQPCGFHKGGLLESTTIMGRRDADNA